MQEWNEIQFNGVYYAPPKKGAPGEEPTFDTSYTFNYPRPKRPENLRIYECHVGMSSEEPKVRVLCWPSLEFWNRTLPLHMQSWIDRSAGPAHYSKHLRRFHESYLTAPQTAS